METILVFIIVGTAMCWAAWRLLARRNKRSACGSSCGGCGPTPTVLVTLSKKRP